MVQCAQDFTQVMSRSDLARLTGLGWDTVKDLVKERLERDHGGPRRRSRSQVVP